MKENAKTHKELMANIILCGIPLSIFCMYIDLSESFLVFAIACILSVVFWPICGFAGHWCIRSLKKTMIKMLKNHKENMDKSIYYRYQPIIEILYSIVVLTIIYFIFK